MAENYVDPKYDVPEAFGIGEERIAKYKSGENLLGKSLYSFDFGS